MSLHRLVLYSLHRICEKKAWRRTHPRLSFLVDALLVVKEHLHGLHVLLVDGVQQGVLGLDLVLQQQLHHVQVLVVDAHEEGGPAQGIDAAEIDDISLCLQHPESVEVVKRRLVGRAARRLKRRKKLGLL